jgi:hypothetical protein
MFETPLVESTPINVYKSINAMRSELQRMVDKWVIDPCQFNIINVYQSKKAARLNIIDVGRTDLMDSSQYDHRYSINNPSEYIVEYMAQLRQHIQKYRAMIKPDEYKTVVDRMISETKANTQKSLVVKNSSVNSTFNIIKRNAGHGLACGILLGYNANNITVQYHWNETVFKRGIDMVASGKDVLFTACAKRKSSAYLENEYDVDLFEATCVKVGRSPKNFTGYIFKPRFGTVSPVFHEDFNRGVSLLKRRTRTAVFNNL